MTAFGCDEFGNMAPELALGLLAGDDRGEAIAHLATCSRCRRHLEGLVHLADDLLLLAPPVEPDIGFESRVMARLDADGAFAPAAAGGERVARPGVSLRPTQRSPRARRQWARPVAMAVAATLIVVAGVTGLVTGLSRGREAGRNSALGQQAQAADQLAARTVVVRADGGQSTCQLVAFPGDGSDPAHLVIRLDEPPGPPSTYQVLAEPTDGGPAVLIGTLTVVDGHAMLSAPIPHGTGPVHAVRIVEGPHSAKYRATFKSV